MQTEAEYRDNFDSVLNHASCCYFDGKDVAIVFTADVREIIQDYGVLWRW